MINRIKLFYVSIRIKSINKKLINIKTKITQIKKTSINDSNYDSFRILSYLMSEVKLLDMELNSYIQDKERLLTLCKKNKWYNYLEIYHQ